MNSPLKIHLKNLVAPVLAMALASLMPLAARAAFTAGNLAVFSADTASVNNSSFTILELSPSASQSSAVNAIAINGTSGTTALRTSGSGASTGYLAGSADGKLLIFTAHNTTATSGNINTVTARGIGTLDNAGTYTLQATYTGASGNQTRGANGPINSTWFVGDQGGIYINAATAAVQAGNFRSVKSFGGALYVCVASSSYPPVLALATAPVGTNGLPGLPVGSSAVQDFYLIASGSNGANYDVLYVLAASSATAGTIYKYSLVSGSWTANGTYATAFGGFGLCAAANGGGAVLYVTTGTGATAANSVVKLVDAAGYNATLAITTANNVTLYTAATGTTMKGIAFAPVCTGPTAAVRGADSTAVCSGGGATVHADLTGTSPWSVTWSDGTVQTGLTASPAALTVSPAATTTYTVTAVSDASACSSGTASGSATVTVNAIPNSTLAAASSVCPGSTGNTASVANAGYGAGYGWTITGGAITAGAATNSITFTANASGTVVLGCTVTNSSGCYSNASSLAITISEAVTTTAANSGPVCEGGTISLTATGDASDTYSWTGPNSFTSTAQNPAIANATGANAGVYSVTRTTACGTSPAATTTVVVNPIPNSTITAASPVCGNATGNTASVPDAGTGAGYGWTLSGGHITAGSGTAAITYTAGASGSVVLGCTVTNSTGCYSNASTATVVITALPDATISTLAATYAGCTTNTAAVPDAGPGAAYAWIASGGAITAGSGTRAITFTAGAAGTLTLGCTVTGSATCDATASTNVTVSQPFTTRNLAVVRVGDGTAALSSAATAVFVDEYATNGARVQSLALPPTGGSALATSGSASSEGGLSRALDGSAVCVAGYHTNTGVASIANTTAAAVPRAVAAVNAGGVVTLAATTTTQFSGNNIRSAATDGTNNFWAAGGSSGTYYFGTASAAAVVQSTLANTRVINLVNGNLFFTAGAGGGLGLYSLAGLPTASATLTTNILTGTGSSPYGFALNAGGTVAYLADDRAIAAGGGIQKWTNAAGAWSLLYTLGTGPGSTNGARGLAVDFSGANPLIYATTTEASTNRLIGITDTGSGAGATTLAMAAANTVFRGVAFAPEAAPVLTLQPASLITCGGSGATFTAAAEGAATLAAQWQASTDNGANFSNLAGATADSYTLTPAAADSGKQFRVIYTNNYGAATSSIATLAVGWAGATNFTWNAYWGASFKLAESNVLSQAGGAGGVVWFGLDAASANGVSLTETNGVIYYNGGVAAPDSFHYTVASVTGGCTATALISVSVTTNISPVALGWSGGYPQLSFEVISNYNYTVQRSTNLTGWDDLFTTNAPGLFNYVDALAPQPAAFYRLRYNP